jgi:hydrogenase maturation protease
VIRVIGFGNPFQGDDGFGPAVVRALSARSWPPGVSVIDGGAPGLAALSLFDGCDAVLVVDALRDGGPPGELGWVDAEELAGLASDPLHGGGLSEMLRVMPMGLTGKLPVVKVLLGRIGEIQPFCDTLSGPLAAAVPRAVGLIEARIAALTAGRLTRCADHG